MTAVLGLMGGLLQINPIWNLGPTSHLRCRRVRSPTFT
ncbi:ubiquinol-cytochrome c reductase cytochrome b subunit domain protein [Mycobacterium xenopi 3993]|nr:ubiquinol-cytochrome c reductase cytochrome b subunit domain protein [Mycobacterium xenopi 3993]